MATQTATPALIVTPLTIDYTGYNMPADTTPNRTKETRLERAERRHNRAQRQARIDRAQLADFRQEVADYLADRESVSRFQI